MRSRTTLLVLLLAFAGLAIVALPAGAASDTTEVSSQEDDLIQECAAEPPADFSDPAGGNEVIGWVDGYWYSEPLDINVTDGLNQDELVTLSARTAARFEAMRCIAATEGVPPVDIQTRDEFQESQSTFYENIPQKDRLADNAIFETMLMISSEENSSDLREANRGEVVGGFYNFEQDRIVVVSDTPESLQIDEEVLAHEIGHAVQDQQFNLSQYERPTTDIDKGILGLIEGDVDLIEYRYLQACDEGRWEQPCATQESDDEGDDSGDLPSWGLYFQSFQPYNDGPAFIQQLLNEEFNGDWEQVNAMYDDPPRSALYSVFPETYEEVELADVEVPDRSTDDWERITFNGSVNYDTVGVASISAMFKTPTYETGGNFEGIYAIEDILNTGPSGAIDDFKPLNYDHPETEGWRDDKIYTYRNDANETGAVWKLEWTSEEAMQPFIDGYEELVNFRGGEPVEGYEYTYTFGEDSEYDMVLTLVPDGNQVTIVKAPSVDELTNVHDVDLVESENNTDDNPDDTNDGTDNSDDTDDSDDTDNSDSTDDSGGESDDRDSGTGNDSNDDSDDSADDGGAGFGVAAGLLAALLVTLVGVRRR